MVICWLFLSYEQEWKDDVTDTAGYHDSNKQEDEDDEV